MAELKTYFTDFIKNIRPNKEEKDDLKDGHTELRKKLESDQRFKDDIVGTLLQGSYRRATALTAGEKKKSDVDIIVVTRLSRDDYTAAEALNHFKPFFEDNYEGEYELNSRSYEVNLEHVDLDVVFTSAPSEVQERLVKSLAGKSFDSLDDSPSIKFSENWRGIAHLNEASYEDAIRLSKSEEEWKTEPLWIPDREVSVWERTHPIEQIQWTRDKNANCNGHFVNVVKAIKWWRRHSVTNKYPKGYPVEHLIGETCNDETQSIAEGVCTTLENIISNYSGHIQRREVPELPDRGVPEHNVFARVTFDDFKIFYDSVDSAAKLARAALDESDPKKSHGLWRELFGDSFPPLDDDNDDDNGRGGYTKKSSPGVIGGGRFG